MGFAEVLFSALTDFTFVPGLYAIFLHRRKFELFIGIFQFISAVLFNASEAFGTSLFIPTDQWHFISDIMSLTLVCSLLVHFMGIKDTDVSEGVKYISLAFAWIFKARDSWEHVNFEAFLVIGYSLAAIAGFSSMSSQEKSRYNSKGLLIGISCAGVAGLILILQLLNIEHLILIGFMHVAAGAASFFLWSSIPRKKMGKTLPTEGTFV